MHDLLNKRYVISSAATMTGSNGVVDFNATGDKFILHFPHPVDITRWGLITIGLMDPDADGFNVNMDLRPTVGSDTNRVTAAGGAIQRADADTIAAGNVVYVDVKLPVAASTAGDGSTVNVEPAGPLRVNPGQEVVLAVSNAVGAASTGYLWVEYVSLPFQTAGLSNVALDT